MTGNKRLVEAVLIDHVFHGRTESQIARDKNIPEGLVNQMINLRVMKGACDLRDTIVLQSKFNNEDVTNQ